MRHKRLTPHKQKRLFKEAREYFEGFPIDWSQMGEPEIEGLQAYRTVYDARTPFGRQERDDTQDELVIGIVWTKKDDPDVKIELTNIWWHEDTGAILQAGSNYGRLVI